jgi:hypothetical protein
MAMPVARPNPPGGRGAITGDGAGASGHMQSRGSIVGSTLSRELSRAEEQVAKDPDRIAHQRVVLSHHEEGGLDCAIARAILEQLEALQRVHIAERDRLLARS